MALCFFSRSLRTMLVRSLGSAPVLENHAFRLILTPFGV